MRIGEPRAIFNNMRRAIYSGKLSLTLKIRIPRPYVFSVLLYEVEA